VDINPDMIVFMKRRIRDPKILRILNTTVEFDPEQLRL
jgi:hypothetical protein